MNRVFIVIACCAATLFSNVTGESFAATIHMQRVNPMYRSLWEKKAALPPARHNVQATRVCTSLDDVKDAIRYSLERREIAFGFEMVYDFSFSDVEGILDQAFDEVFWADDYLAYNFMGYGDDSDSSGWKGNDGDVTVTYAPVTYLTTYENELYVNERVAVILADIISDNMTDVEKEKAIHDWIVSNVAYDESAEPQYSAYAALADGTTVCQGYSLLNFKMLETVGITARIVASDKKNHAWNMISVCGHWYHEDLTWDDPVPDVEGRILYDYYNLSDCQISDKDPVRADWPTSTLPPPPLAPESYVEDICIIYGDFDGNNLLDLADLVVALKICAGIDPALVNKDAAPDSLVDMADAIYIIQTISGLR